MNIWDIFRKNKNNNYSYSRSGYEVKEKQLSFVIETSRKIKAIQALNKRCYFLEIQDPYIVNRSCCSKKEFDHIDLEDFLIECVLEDPDRYKSLLEKADKNRFIFRKYSEYFYSILRTDSEEEKHIYEKYPFYRELEKGVCYKSMLNPVLTITVRAEKTYISPQGRKNYSDFHIFERSEIEKCFTKSKKITQNRESVQYERMLMTDSLRYNVMKRDGFRCTICGATSHDGVKLHVDHIFPVSRGGKTELDNLRTLCERCNHGKAAKYDENGIN